MQEAEEPAAEAEAERTGDFRLVVQRRVVETQLRERVAELLVVLRIHRKEPGEYPRLDLLEAREQARRRTVLERDGVPDRRAIDLLDARDHEADVARAELLLDDRLGREAAEPVDMVAAAGGENADLVAALQAAVHDPHQRYHAHVVVEPGVDDERLQWRRAVAARAPGCAG